VRAQSRITAAVAASSAAPSAVRVICQPGMPLGRVVPHLSRRMR
jgi:hypothetical protein